MEKEQPPNPPKRAAGIDPAVDFPIDTRGAVAFLLSVILGAVALAFTPPLLDVSQRFYEIAAQVIPVFLLTTAVEGRVFRIDQLEGKRNRQLVVMSLMLIVAGEASALGAVAFECSSGLTELYTITALLTSGGLVVSAALYGRDRMP